VNRAEFLQELTENQAYKRICLKYAGSLADDLFQEVALILAETPEDKLEDIKCPSCWITKIIGNQWHSSTSPFYNKYRKRIFPEREEGEDIPMPSSGDVVSKLDWYETAMLLEYTEQGSLRGVEKKTGIDHSSVHKTITKAKAKVMTKPVKPFKAVYEAGKVNYGAF